MLRVDWITPDEILQLKDDFSFLSKIEESSNRSPCLFSSSGRLDRAYDYVLDKIKNIKSRFSERYPDESQMIVNNYFLTEIAPYSITFPLLKMLLNEPHSHAAAQKVFVEKAMNLGRKIDIKNQQLEFIVKNDPMVRVFTLDVHPIALFRCIEEHLENQVEFLFRLADGNNQQCDQEFIDMAFFVLVRDDFHQCIYRMDKAAGDARLVTPDYLAYLEERYAGQERIARLLIDHGANVFALHEYAYGENGKITARQMAEKNSYDHLVRIIDAVENRQRLST